MFFSLIKEFIKLKISSFTIYRIKNKVVIYLFKFTITKKNKIRERFLPAVELGVGAENNTTEINKNN